MITASEAAEVIADVTGTPVKHNDIDRDVWTQGSVAAGVPADYGERLRMLTETIASGWAPGLTTTSRRSLGRRRSSSLTLPGEPRRRGHRRGLS